MNIGQKYITDKGRTMEVITVSKQRDRARCDFYEKAELVYTADVIISKCKSYKLVDNKEESK